jgi:hypothetical protein
MVGRPFIAALALAAATAVAPVSLLAGFAFAGQPAPASVTVSSMAVPEQHGVVLKWVIRSEDVVACETAAADLRRFKHAYKDRLHIVVYGVATDTALVRSFLRDEMIGGVDLRRLSEREFQQFARQFGRPMATPLIVLTDASGRDQAFDADMRLASGRREVATIGLAINTILRSVGILASHSE